MLSCQDKNRRISFHICIKMRYCKTRVYERTTLFGQPNTVWSIDRDSNYAGKHSWEHRADVDTRSVPVLEITGFGKRGKSQAILHRFQIAGKRPARSHGCPLLVDKRRCLRIVSVHRAASVDCLCQSA